MFEGNFSTIEHKVDSIVESEEKEKTREELLEEFKNSLREYGVEGAEVRLEGNKLNVEQKYGEGIRGLGSSNSSVWLCLIQEDLKSFKENQKLNHYGLKVHRLDGTESPVLN